MIDNDDNHVFGAVSYCNAAPLAHFLPESGRGVRVVYDRPSQLAARLLDGGVDVALIPVVDYFAYSSLKMIGGLGICADGDVRSVVLRCTRPLKGVRTVAPDPASRTSNALARILLEDHFHLSARVQRCSPGESADASVVIGDRALCEEPGEFGDYDLGGAWKAMTSLPFVFAVWAYRQDHPDRQSLGRIAHKARDLGVGRIDELAAIHAKKLSLGADDCREYLTSVIKYDLGSAERSAMELFRQLWATRQDCTALPTDQPGGAAG